MPQGDTDSTCSRTADEDVAAASQMEQDQDMSGPTTDITRIQDIQQCSASPTLPVTYLQKVRRMKTVLLLVDSRLPVWNVL